jgi:hypothetical protein
MKQRAGRANTKTAPRTPPAIAPVAVDAFAEDGKEGSPGQEPPGKSSHRSGLPCARTWACVDGICPLRLLKETSLDQFQSRDISMEKTPLSGLRSFIGL